MKTYFQNEKFSNCDCVKKHKCDKSNKELIRNVIVKLD